MFAFNEFSSSYSSFSPIPELPMMCNSGTCGTEAAQNNMGMDTGNLMETSDVNAKKKALKQKLKKIIHIPGAKDLIRQIGIPDVTDSKYGGIAIWSKPTLKKKKYGFLSRVEIIDEQVPSTCPVQHNSNVYTWIKMKPNNEQQGKLLQLSKNFFYDRKKELMIIRSDSLDSCIAMGALLTLYLRGNVSYYNIVNNDMLKTYYEGVKEPKRKRAIFTIINTIKSKN